MGRIIIGQCRTFGILFLLISAQLVRAEERNVILIIGDGMDDHQITIARNYLAGVRGRLNLDNMPVRSAVQVLTVSEDDPEVPVYVADSANSATAMATGVVTSRGRIATSAKEDLDIPSIVELAHSAGYRTGIVSSASVTDATPAAFIAHISIRGCENPERMKNYTVGGEFVIDCSRDLKSNGGLGSIAEQIVESNVDVILGGGRKHFSTLSESVGNKNSVPLLQLASDSGYRVIKETADLDDANIALDGKKLLGLFAEAELPVRLRGENGRSGEAPNPSILNSMYWALGSVEIPDPMLCEKNPSFDGVPDLKKLTDVAIGVLSKDNARGFFLMVESASIDKQSHARNACGSIGELQQLGEVLDSALAFANEHKNTLILVTADHGQAAQLVPNESLFNAYGVPVFTPGHIVRVKTPQNAVLAVNYATNNFFIEEHTGVNVPLFANDVGKPLISTFISQPHLFFIMRDYLQLGFEPSGEHSPEQARQQSVPVPVTTGK